MLIIIWYSAKDFFFYLTALRLFEILSEKLSLQGHVVIGREVNKNDFVSKYIF